MRITTLIVSSALVPLAVACGPEAPVDRAAPVENAIVGGNLEPTRYPAMGYLVFRLESGPHAGEIFRPDCGATLIAPNVVVTAAHCVEEKTSRLRTVVAAGFGDGHTGPTYGLVGTWQDWIHPRALFEYQWPDGEVVHVVDPRHDVAVIQLERAVEGIEPMPLSRRPMPPGTPALVIGYGRATEGPHDELDYLPIRPDHPDRYPGLRKSADLEIVLARSTIDAFPLPDTPERRSGGTCFADSGSALILADGSITGVLVSQTREDQIGELADGKPHCHKDRGGTWANLQAPNNASFIEQRLEIIAAGGVK